MIASLVCVLVGGLSAAAGAGTVDTPTAKATELPTATATTKPTEHSTRTVTAKPTVTPQGTATGKPTEPPTPTATPTGTATPEATRTATARCPLDVDGNGRVQAGADVFYLRQFAEQSPHVVPPEVREFLQNVGVTVPSEATLKEAIEESGRRFDVDGDFRVVPDRDVLYIDRFVQGARTIVPFEQRAALEAMGSHVPSEEEIAAKITSLCPDELER